MRDRTLGDTFYLAFTTRAFATGIPTSLAGTPIVSAYHDVDLVQITNGITLVTDFDGIAGLNMLTIVATAGNGYVDGGDYQLVINIGTVDGISVVGEVIGQFSLGLNASFKRLGTPVLASISQDIDGIKTDVSIVKVDTTAILIDTADMQPKLGTPAIDISTDINAIKTETALIKSDSTAILADTNDIQPKIGTPATDLSADIAAIKSDTGPLATDWLDGGRLDLLIDRLILEIDTAKTEPGQTAPPLSAKMGLKIDYLYKLMRNRTISTTTLIQVFADDGATVDHVRSHTDDGTSYTRGELSSGP